MTQSVWQVLLHSAAQSPPNLSHILLLPSLPPLPAAAVAAVPSSGTSPFALPVVLLSTSLLPNHLCPCLPAHNHRQGSRR